VTDNLPPDPFGFDDPRLDDHAIPKYVREAAQLTAAFANIGSLSGLVETLNKADRRDVELVAMLAISTLVRDSFAEVEETKEAADARFLEWMLDAPTTEPLD
jgi:hypothetical protein